MIIDLEGFVYHPSGGNKLYVAEQESGAEEIVKCCRQNSFKNVRFSYDQLIPIALCVTEHFSKQQAENGKWMFSLSYLSEYKDGMYNIVNDSDKISLRK